MTTQGEWEDKHLQVHPEIAVARKAPKEATRTGNRVIKTQEATGELVKGQQ